MRQALKVCSVTVYAPTGALDQLGAAAEQLGWAWLRALGLVEAAARRGAEAAVLAEIEHLGAVAQGLTAGGGASCNHDGIGDR